MTNSKSNRPFFRWTAGLAVLLATICCLVYLVEFSQVSQAADEPTVRAQDQTQAGSSKAHLTPEESEQFYEMMKRTEGRGYENKMMARELLRYVKVMTIILALAAVGFPLSMWLLSRKRLLGLSGLSGEVTATLLVVEERQAKLANILKDIQGEIDYMHTMSVPDLKNLIQQAEKYLKQNEQDLEKAGLGKGKQEQQ